MQLTMLLSIVAMTRPKRHLCIVGDSETVARYVGSLCGFEDWVGFESDMSQRQSLPETVDGVPGGTCRSAVPRSQRPGVELIVELRSTLLSNPRFDTDDVVPGLVL
jgi:hypothetical protein